MHRAKKSLGQHFLVDRAAIRRIVETVPAGASVLEIGPGRGALTEPLLTRAARLVVVEKDDALAALWQARAAREPRLQVVHGDALKHAPALVATNRIDWVVGNLPYNISGPITAALAPLPLRGMTLMYQHEVAARIAALPGTRAYGRLSALVRWRWRPRLLFTLSPGAFTPPPRVRSAVVVLAPSAPLPAPFPRYAAALRLGFRHPRKTLANNLRGALDAEAIAALGIDPCARPAAVSPEAWARIATALPAAALSASPGG